MKKKTNLNAVSKNSAKKSPAKTQKNKPAKPPTIKKGTDKTTTKSLSEKTYAKGNIESKQKALGKVVRAEALRQQSVKDMNKLSRIPTAWSNKLQTCKNSAERKKVDDTYKMKFIQAEKVEAESYKAYYDFVSKNFTVEEQKTAMSKSKDFMSKKFINALKG